MINPNVLYTTAEAADVLKVAPITIKRYISENKIQSSKINGLRRIQGAELLNLTNQQQKTFTTIDLFAGVGGVRLGFESAGFKTIFANDFEPKCKTTYDRNFTTTKLTVKDIRDVKTEELPDFDFLLGGFPCQAFSIAGYREGLDDEKGRGNLFLEIVRILKAKQPQGFFLENVKNLLSHDDGKTYQIIKRELTNAGYFIKEAVLNSMDYGNVPQNRERVYIVGFQNQKQADGFCFPSSQPLKTKVCDLLEQNVNDKYYYNGKSLYEKLKNDVVNPNSVYQWRRQYVRENKSNVCPTLTANMGTGGHNVPLIKDGKGIRKLTPQECFRIQGFPSNYVLPNDISDSALYMQAGNSVSVPVISRIAEEIKKALLI